jgi:hypothetical protein
MARRKVAEPGFRCLRNLAQRRRVDSLVKGRPGGWSSVCCMRCSGDLAMQAQCEGGHVLLACCLALQLTLQPSQNL